jgi:hypothetical protein
MGDSEKTSVSLKSDNHYTRIFKLKCLFRVLIPKKERKKKIAVNILKKAPPSALVNRERFQTYE